MPQLSATVRPGNPDFLDLEWEKSIVDWDTPRIVTLPKGISRHEVRFVVYEEGTYAIKELPVRAARRDYEALRRLEEMEVPAVTPVALIEFRTTDHHEEASAALITKYEEFSFSYRELLEGPGFGSRRNQMLDAIAWLLVELHLAGCFWGDCSLSNVLYRYDADTIETILVDAETAEIQPQLTDGRRIEDIEIMIMNVAGGMADIAASQGYELDDADLNLGEDIAARYLALWTEVNQTITIPPEERYRISEVIKRYNDLGFTIHEVDLAAATEDGHRLTVQVRVGGRSFHIRKLRELTGVEALEGQARQILSDFYYFRATQTGDAVHKSVAAIQWRVTVLEPMLNRLRALPDVNDPLQAFCDVLYHRFAKSSETGHDVGTEVAYQDWLAEGRPGYPLA